MTTLEKRKLIRIAEFARLRFLPALKEANTPGQGWLQRYSLGELLESVWWLIQGVEVNFFPSTEATALWSRYAESVSDKFDGYMTSNMDFYPPALVSDLRTRIVENSIFGSSSDTGDDQTDSLAYIFDQGLLLSTAMQDRLGRLVGSTLLFAPESDWEKVSGGVPDAAQVEMTLSDAGEEFSITPSAVVAGLWKSLDHMGASRAHFDSIDLHLVDAKMPRYRQINAWRFNFFSATFSKRFDRTAEMLADLAARQRMTEAAEFRTRFLRNIRDLSKNWSTNHPFMLANRTTA